MAATKAPATTEAMTPIIEVPTVFESLYTEKQPGESHPRLRLSATSLPPDYTEALELNAVTPSSSRTSNESLPRYDDVTNDANAASSSTTSTAPGFVPTRCFQIENRGHPLIALPLPPKPHPIPVYSVTPTGDIGELAYTSMRDPASAGVSSSVLVRAEDDAPVSVTTYRFGCGRPPAMRLDPNSTDKVLSPDDVVAILKSDPTPETERIEVTSDGYTTRSQTIRTPLGTFRWRYGNRTERQDANAASLLVFERITTVALAKGKPEERRRRVAQFVRNDDFRSEGSSRRTAGNGGRLMIDLREWTDKKREAAEAEILAVASCLVMMKKEIDRRRLHQTVVLVVGVTGA